MLDNLKLCMLKLTKNNLERKLNLVYWAKIILFKTISLTSNKLNLTHASAPYTFPPMVIN